MTVESYFRGKFQGIGRLIDPDVLGVAADSPGDLGDERFMALSLDMEKSDYAGDKIFSDSLKYALSTLYYAMSGATDGGTRSEKRGNRQISIGGKAIDVATREAWRKEADRLRRELGCEIEEVADSGGMCDGSIFRPRYPNWRSHERFEL